MNRTTNKVSHVGGKKSSVGGRETLLCHNKVLQTEHSTESKKGDSHPTTLKKRLGTYLTG